MVEDHYLIPSINFAMVCPGVYRSGYPSRKNFPFLKKVGIKSIIYLVPEDCLDGNREFYAATGINLMRFGIEGNKEPFVDIPDEVIPLHFCVQSASQHPPRSALHNIDLFIGTKGASKEKTCSQNTARSLVPRPYAYVQATLGIGSVNFCTIDFGGAFFNSFYCVAWVLSDTLVLRCTKFIFCVEAPLLAKRAFVACFASWFSE